MFCIEEIAPTLCEMIEHRPLAREQFIMALIGPVLLG